MFCYKQKLQELPKTWFCKFLLLTVFHVASGSSTRSVRKPSTFSARTSGSPAFRPLACTPRLWALINHSHLELVSAAVAISPLAFFSYLGSKPNF